MSNGQMVEKAYPSGVMGDSLGTERVNSGHGSRVDKDKRIVTNPQYPRHCGITECTEAKKSGAQGRG